MPTRSSHVNWEVAIFLPRRRPQKSDGKMFYGKLTGQTEVYPFLAGDEVAIRPSAVAPILQWLGDSHFAGQEWIIRATARHSRSKTVTRVF